MPSRAAHRRPVSVPTAMYRQVFLAVWVAAARETQAEIFSTSQTRTAKLVEPAWDFSFPGHSATCLDAGTTSSGASNARWVYHAVPAGTPPKNGWPIWLSLVTDPFGKPNSSATCGDAGGWSRGKPFGAFSTPKDTMKTCFQPSPPPGTASESQRRRAQWPHQNSSLCYYDQEAGAMWDQRLKQFLVSNGVAVVQINPIETDSWDAGPWWWNPESSADRPFLTKLFTQMKAGAYGPLDISRTIIRGWSSGAQMVSWLSQAFATNGTLVPGMVMRGGVMFSGGSYLCYNDAGAPGNPPGADPVGSCAGCTEGGPSHCQDDPLCSSCTVGVKTYCGQCCPRNYTEPYFAENPTAYSKHVPMFLAQTSKVDNHADLCACRNYYETLAAHKVANSQLVLMDAEDENCFCIGAS